MAALDTALAWIGRFNDVLCTIYKHIAWVLIAVMTIAVLVQVLFRYGFNSPIAWTEEFSIFAMIWMTFLIAPIAYRRGAFVAIEIIRDLFKGRLQAALQLFLNILAMLVILSLFKHSIIYVDRGFVSTAASLPVSNGWLYMSMPLGLAVMLTVGIEVLLKCVRGLLDPSTSLPMSSHEAEVEAGEYE